MPFTHFKLHANILKAIKESGYTSPSPIQAKAIPVICAGKDLIASAQTGTGKTAAFVLPALQYLINNPATHGKPRILILSPTRELAQQIEASAKKYGKHMRFNAISIVGGMPYRQQFRQLSRPLDMIIATPGRFMDLMERPDSLDLSHINIFVLDEADRMLDMGFIDDVAHIAKCLEKASRSKQRQTLLFSATLDAKIGKLAKNLLNDPELVEVTPPKVTHTQIEQRLYVANDTAHKNALLDYILENESIHQGIIFSATKRHADNFAKHLRDRGYKAVAMHGDMKQSQRIRTLDQLRHGKIQFLIATDVAARGIDIHGISHVINYDLPRTGEDYTHRIGRTGRAGNTGVAITFALSSEGRAVQQIERMLGTSITQHTVPGLEPRSGFKHSASPAQKRGSKKKFGGNGNKSRYGQSRGNDNYGKSGPSRFNKSDKKPAFAKKHRDSDTRSFEKPEFTKKRRDSDSPSYAKSDFTKKRRDPDAVPFGKSDFSKKRRDSDSSYAKPDFAQKRRGSDAAPFGKTKNVNGNSIHFEGSARAKPDYAKKRQPHSSRFSNDRNTDDRRSYGQTTRFEKPDFANKRQASDASSYGKPDFSKKKQKKVSSGSYSNSKPFAGKKLSLKKKKSDR